MLLSDLPTPQVLIDRARDEQHRADPGARVGAGVAPAAARQDPQVALVARWQIDAARSASAARSSAKPRCSPTPGITDIRLPYPVNPVNAPRADRPDGSRVDLDHRRPSGRRARLVGRDAARRRARSTSSSRSTSASIDAASIRDGRPVEFIQAVAALPGLRLRGLLSHAGHAYHATSEDELRAIAKAEAETLRTLRARAGAIGIAARRDLGRRDADAAIQRRTGRCHRAAARQLRLLRSDAGGARRRVARRLRADRDGHRRVEASRTASSSTAAARR